MILVTRPIHQAKLLIDELASVGLTSLSLPTLEISSIKSAETKKAFTKIDQTDQIIFTSANAVDCAMPMWPKIIEHNPTIIAIGPGTKRALTNHGIDVDLLPDRYSSEGLLEMPELEEVAGENILIITGKNPRPVLNDTLTERGADVTEAHVYQRGCPKYTTEEVKEIMAHDIKYIVSASLESLENCLTIFKDHIEWLKSKTFVVINMKMHKLLKEMGFEHLILADDATTQSIVNAITGMDE